MRLEDQVKLFALNNLAIETSIRQTAKWLGVDIGKCKTDDGKDQIYYPQFPERLRAEALEMAKHYEIFFCLENAIRSIIKSRLEETSSDWWESRVPENVRNNAVKNRSKELGTGVTPRSSEMLAYTNFGELGEIIKANWPIFSDMLTDIRAVEAVLSRLNTLRAPIAHCCTLSEDEVVRLNLSVRDWFRLME